MTESLEGEAIRATTAKTFSEGANVESVERDVCQTAGARNLAGSGQTAV